MVVLNNMLNEMAQALAGSSYVLPSYLAFGSDTLSISVSDSAITGEIGSRSATTNSTASASVTFNAIRTGASVASSAGESLNAAYLISASSGGTLLSELTLPSLLHTTNFDIDTDWSFTFQRRGGTS